MFCVRVLVVILLAGLFACAPVVSQKQQEAKQQADMHYQMGVSHLQSNSPTMALKELLQASQNGRDDSELHAALAQAYQLKKAYTKAETHYLRAIALSDNNPRYHNNLASLYLVMQKWDKAINHFEIAGSNLLFFNSHVALTGIGFAYLKKQDYPAALQQFEEVIAVTPRYAQVYYLQSETYEAMGQSENARRSMEKAIEVAPGFAQAIYQLGVMLLKEQQIAAATEKFERVVDLAPTSEWGMQSAEMLRRLSRDAAGKN